MLLLTLPLIAGLIISLLVICFFVWHEKYHYEPLQPKKSVRLQKENGERRTENAQIELRYVYADGSESRYYNPFKGRVYGYRITNSLILHETFGAGGGWRLSECDTLRKKCGARYLSYDEFVLVTRVWKKLNRMRLWAMDYRQPAGFYWVKSENCSDDNGNTPEDCTLIHSQTLKEYPYCEFDDDGNCLFAILV